MMPDTVRAAILARGPYLETTIPLCAWCGGRKPDLWRQIVGAWDLLHTETCPYVRAKEEERRLSLPS